MANSNLPPLPLPEDKWDQLAQQLELSRRQRQIIELILRNQGNRQIAAELGVEECTICTYSSRILHRFHVGDRQELILYLFALSHGRGHRA